MAAGNSDQIPIFERLWLGGEYSIRGYDIRRIGPTLADRDPEVSANDTFQGRYVIGGNKSLLFNAEYQISIADPVRIVAFYDAGQVQDFGQNVRHETSFMTSTGVELRFFIPMLNVPFRLIYAWNPQYESCLQRPVSATGTDGLPVCRGNDLLACAGRRERIEVRN